MAKTFTPLESWQGRHRAFDQQIEGMYELSGHSLDVEGYKRACKEFQTIIKEAIKTKKNASGYGQLVVVE